MTISRRVLLRGAGATVAIPVLPSLLRATDAEAQALITRPCFVNLGTHHGGAWERFMVPSMRASELSTQRFGGRDIRRAPLTRIVDGNTASLSAVLSAPESQLTSRLVEKLFVLRGLDVPFYLGHHTGGHLGNFARNDATGGDGVRAQQDAVRATIDQLMSWSPSFYSDLSAVKERVLVLSPRTSFAWKNPATRDGAIQEVGPTASTPLHLFRRLFPSAPGRTPLVDRVLENYRRVRANPSLSRNDRDRLDDHVQRLSELERRLSTMAMCPAPAAPPAEHAQREFDELATAAPYVRNPDEQAAWLRAMNDLVVAAFSCGLSRIAVSVVNANLSTFAGNWHEDVAHQADAIDGARQDLLWRSYNVFFRDVFLDLARKLDGVSLGTGQTLLDATLLCWTQESGARTHEARDQVVVGIGSAGGRINTGFVADYRNLDMRFEAMPSAAISTHPGLLWQQWLGSVLQIMGVPRHEWERANVNGGYPDYAYSNVQWQSIDAATAYPSATWSVAGERLPFL